MANRKPLVINNGAVEQLQAADTLNVSHDSLPDFVANEHIDHSGVSVTAGDGLTGGGTIEATRTLDLNIAELSTVVIIAAGDYVPFEQISPSVANKKITFADFESDLNHDNLTDFVANEHIDHSGVSVTAGDGLTGGGTIEATRTLDLDIAKLSTAVIIASGDYIPFEQISPSVTNKKITFANFESDLNHDNLTDFVANKHIDHTGVTVTAGDGLTGGGTIEANIALALSHLGIESLTDPGADKILFWDDSEEAFKWLTVGDYLTLSGTNLTASPGYVSRGDPGAGGWDITETSLTLDGTWRDLSLSGFGVPAGAYAVQIRVFFKAATIGKYAGIRPNGNTYEMQAISQYTQSASTMEMQGFIPCDASRLVEYNGNAALTIFRLVVKGWLI